MFEDYTIEDLDKFIKCKEYLRSKIDIIKEQFIKFYGEDLRDKIDNSFNNALFVAYKTPLIESMLLDRLRYLITRNILKKYLSEDTSWDVDKLINGDNTNVSFKYEAIMPLKNFVDFYEAISKGDKAKLESLFEKVKPILREIDSNITYQNYLDYINDPRIQELEALARKYYQIKDEYNLYMMRYSKEITNEKYFSENSIRGLQEITKQKEIDELLPEHVEVREEINRLNLLNKNDGFDGSIYGMGVLASTNSNVRIVNDEANVFSIILVNCSNQNGNNKFDHYIIHELNHLFESFLVNVESAGYDILCGWDLVNHKLNISEEDEEPKENSFRHYELFNEIINDLIAQEIFEQMRNNNIFIFDKPSNDDNFSSSYQNTRFLVEEFYKKYRRKIIESRRDGNIQIIMDEVGKENFEALNELFKTFKSDEDIHHKVYDPKRKELETKRDEILKNMEIYHSNNHQNSEESNGYKK